MKYTMLFSPDVISISFHLESFVKVKSVMLTWYEQYVPRIMTTQVRVVQDNGEEEESTVYEPYDSLAI